MHPHQPGFNWHFATYAFSPEHTHALLMLFTDHLEGADITPLYL